MLLYGSVAYLLFLGTFLYTVLFVEDVLVPKTIDRGVEGAPGVPGGPFAAALLLDLGLLALFGAQHSIMARRGFKKWWHSVVPPAMERSTFVLTSVLVLAVLMAAWRPIPTPVWELTGTPALVLTVLSWAAGAWCWRPPS